MIARVAAAAGVSAGIAAAAHRAHALSADGALAATGVGVAILTTTGWRGGVLLGSFFVSSSLLSRAAPRSAVAAKGSRRDARQVLANGGVAAAAALLASSAGVATAQGMLAGALAAATADTWATELGATSGSPPRLAVSGRLVPAGTSGGVTPRGTLGSLAGALALAGVAAITAGAGQRRALASRVAIAGVAGALVDSVLGELVQERRRCPSCDKPTEARVHRCGTPTTLIGGIRGIDNDVVNLACTLTGALVVAVGNRRASVPLENAYRCVEGRFLPLHG